MGSEACRSDRGTPEAASVPSVAGPASFDETTGAIEGAILTDEGLPIQGAEIALTPGAGQNTTRSDETGRFVFGRIAPGDYGVVVAALGYESAVKHVQVAAGEASRVDFLLTPIAVREPYEASKVFQGYWNCAIIGYGILPCPAYVDGTYSNRFMFPVDGNYSAILWEVTWKPSSAATHPSKSTVSFYTGANHYYHGQFTAPPPARILARPGGEPPFPDKESYPSETPLTSIYAHPFGYINQGQYGVGIVLNQRYDVYVTVFYHKDMPDDHSAIPDA